MEGLGEGYVPALSAGKENNSFFKSRFKHLSNFKSILTLKGSGFSNSGTAGEGAICLSL